VGFNFDWHCGDAEVAAGWDCDTEPGWSKHSINIGLDLKDENLLAAAKLLAPGHLRIGGSQQDFVCYDIPSGSCKEKINNFDDYNITEQNVKVRRAKR